MQNRIKSFIQNKPSRKVSPDRQVEQTTQELVENTGKLTFKSSCFREFQRLTREQLLTTSGINLVTKLSLLFEVFVIIIIRNLNYFSLSYVLHYI